jgi:polyphosphate kinase 2 (PPK2 family)
VVVDSSATAIKHRVMQECGAVPPTTMRRKEYEGELERLQVELVHMQRWVVRQWVKVCIVFDGRDTAGKGGVIKRLTERVSPRGLPGRRPTGPK